MTKTTKTTRSSMLRSARTSVQALQKAIMARNTDRAVSIMMTTRNLVAEMHRDDAATIAQEIEDVLSTAPATLRRFLTA